MSTVNFLDFAIDVIASRSPWSGGFYVVVGSILGAFVSGWMAMATTRPRLEVHGGSGSFTVVNRPSFFGHPVNGDTARWLIGYVRPNRKGAPFHAVQWAKTKQSRADVEPGQQIVLKVFEWIEGAPGYSVIDQAGEAVGLYTEPELAFTLRFSDRLQRTWYFKFKVRIITRDSPSGPSFTIIQTKTLSRRWSELKNRLPDFMRRH